MRKVLMSCALALGCFTSISFGQMHIYHINVGQADATLLEFKKAAVLIDAGGASSASDPDRIHLKEFLDRFFARRTDLNRTIYSFIITHPHIDHTRYMMDIFKNYRVLNYVDNGETESGSGLDEIKEARNFIRQKNNQQPNSISYDVIQAGQIGSNGFTPAWLNALRTSPSRASLIFVNASNNCRDENNDSLVVRVQFGQVKLLVSGDAETEDRDCVGAIPRMLEHFGAGTLLDVDIYKVGHHGSANGTNLDFLREMTPRISVISAGRFSDRDVKEKGYDTWNYGHPRGSLVEALLANTTDIRAIKTWAYAMDAAKGKPVAFVSNKAVYCTCWDGDILIPASAAGTLLPVRTHFAF